MAGPMDLPEYKMTGIKIIQLQIAKSELGAPTLVHSEHGEGSGRGGVYGRLLLCIDAAGQMSAEVLVVVSGSGQGKLEMAAATLTEKVRAGGSTQGS